MNKNLEEPSQEGQVPVDETRVLVVDFGVDGAQQVARDVRAAGVFSLVAPASVGAEEIASRAPDAAVLLGGDEDFAVVLRQAGIPVLVTTETLEAAGLEAFLFEEAQLEAAWRTQGMVDQLVAEIRQQVGDDRVILGLSGGVDSSVAAALLHRAVGDQLTCIFVDHGLLRAGERQQVEDDLAGALGINLVTADASARFLEALAGVSDPEEKRKIIGEQFIRVFEDEADNLVAAAAAEGESIKFLAQGTLYPDVMESGAEEGAANIKSHHNVGGLPEDLQFELVEPLRALFKDEVRAIGRALGLAEHVVDRQPFPGPGLGVRVIGDLTKERLDTLRAADAIVREELTAAGLDSQIWQCPVVLLADVRSVGVTGKERTYGHPIVLRPVASEDAMTADWIYLPPEVLNRITTRITSEVDQVNRVVLDVTGKPPGTIEWE